MLWTVILVLLSATAKLASCHSRWLRNRSDVSSYAAYISVAYYVNWAIYDRNFHPQDLPADKLTHVLYAFANISPNTGEAYLSDIWADTQIHLSGGSWNETGHNLYGCFEQFYLLKKANRNLKVLLSIGGSSYSSNFAAPASTSSGRSTFASTAVSLVANLGLDGLDINWENIANPTEAANMVLLLQSVREALDAYGNSLSVPYNFTLTVASPAGPSNYQALHLTDMDRYIDFWNLMAYDYAGSWSTSAANQANIFSSGSDAAATPFDTQTAINYYTSQGIAANKIVLGMPVYGRSFEATEGLGKPFNGVGNGTWEAGVYDFKALPLSGATEFNDTTTGSSYSYDSTKKELVSYDTVLVAKQKAAWIQQMGLCGAMWWESSADGVGTNSLIQNVVEVLGGDDGSGLQNSPNQLLYPNSTYDNLRAGMPGSSSVSAIMPTSTSSMSEAYLCVSASTSGALTTPLPSRAVPASDTSSGSVTILTSTAATSGTTQSTTITINDASTSSTTGSSFCSEVTEVASGQPPQSSITTTLIVPGENGVPGCAYVLASDLGAGAFCSSDYCNCGGTIAPLITSSASGTFSINCNYQTQPTANSCPPSSSITSTTVQTTNIPIFYTSTVLLPPTTVTSIIVVSERETEPTSASIVVSLCLSSTLAAAVSSTSPSSTDIFASSTYSSESTSSASITSSAEPFTSGSNCAIGGSCNNYKVLACPGGECACGQDVNNVPTCVLDEDCATLLKCNTSADCGASKACIANTCCGNGGYCAQLAVGCLTSPAWTSTARAAPICRKIKKRSISASGGGGIGPRLCY